MRRLKKIIPVIALVGAFSINVCASNISDLEGQKSDLESKKKAAQEIVDKMDAEKSDIMAAITELDGKVSELNEEITDLEDQKKELNTEIELTQSELEEAEKQEKEQYEAMKKRIQYSYENGHESFVNVIFAARDMAAMVNENEYAEQIFNYDEKMLGNLIDIKDKVSETKAKLDEELKSVEKIEKDLTEDRDAVNIMIEGKQTQINNYNESIEGYNDQIKQYQAGMDEIDSQISAIMAERLKAEQAAASAGKPVKIYYTGGHFQWPVSSGGSITSTFGPRWGTVHQGLDIACPVGTAIVAGEAGTVIASYYSTSAGEYIVIDHGGGVCTEYMHNSQRLVQAGDTVARGQVIAYSGSTGYSTGPHCHFGLRINGTRVDPYPYLQ